VGKGEEKHKARSESPTALKFEEEIKQSFETLCAV
jgi:hypothetical protein